MVACSMLPAYDACSVLVKAQVRSVKGCVKETPVNQSRERAHVRGQYRVYAEGAFAARLESA
jgi:hypothetical protein